MSFSNLINEERDTSPEEVVKSLRDTIDIIENDREVSVIVMRAVPTDDPEHSLVDLFVHSPYPPLVGEMIAMLNEWRAERIPKRGSTN